MTNTAQPSEGGAKRRACILYAEKVPNPFGGCNAVLVVPPTASERKREP